MLEICYRGDLIRKDPKVSTKRELLSNPGLIHPFGMCILEEREGHLEARKRGHLEHEVTVSVVS